MDPLGEIVRRIKRDIQAGEGLYGVKFDEKFDERNDKADSLPKLRIVDYTMTEDHAGMLSTDVPGETSNGVNTPLRQNQEVVIQLICDERNGWLTDKDTTDIRKMGALNVANMVMDCLEMNDSSEADLTLDDTTDHPIMFQVREAGVLTLGIVIDITVIIKTRLFRRARRSSRIV